MPRTARTVIAGSAHHVTQRGNNRQDVFFVDDDRKNYLSLLKKYSEAEGLRVLAYCLMSNHVHMVVEPGEERSLGRAMARTHLAYTQYINRLHGRSGHLWQSRFYSCGMEDKHLWMAIRYVERNPVRAGIVGKAWEYEWSSAGAHSGDPDRSGLLDMEDWGRRTCGEDWKQELAGADTPEDLQRLRAGTRHGRPLGSDAFISKLEVRFGRRLRALPHGRPKKQKKRARK